jgi:hypothetical protein
MNARSTIAATLTVLALSGASLALGASPALAEFKSITSFGKTAPPVGGLLEEPRGVAVEASNGYVFVASGANVNEQQSVKLAGPFAGGTYTLTFEGQTTGALAYGANQKQSVTLSGATSGTFKLKFTGFSQETAALPIIATAAQVQGELEALTKIGSGNVAVSGGAGGPYTVEFKGALERESIAEALSCNGSGLNAGAKCEVATTVSGQASSQYYWCGQRRSRRYR